MPAAVVVIEIRRLAKQRDHLEANQIGVDHGCAGEGRIVASRKDRRKQNRARMCVAGDLPIIELDGVPGRGVQQRGLSRRELQTSAEHGRAGGCREILEGGATLRCYGLGRADENAAEQVDQRVSDERSGRRRWRRRCDRRERR